MYMIIEVMYVRSFDM